MQIYVVMSQPNFLSGFPSKPVAAFTDYPSALTYAQSIFIPQMGDDSDAKELVFLLNMTTTPPTPVSNVPAAA